MSGTIEAPRGLDALTPEEQRLMESMRDDGPDPTPDAPRTPDAPLATPEPEADFEIDIPEAPEEPARADGRRTVPHAQFHAAREGEKTAKKALAVAEEARIAAEKKLATTEAVVQERLNILTALAQQPPPQPAPVAAPVEEPLPDVNTDPIGHFQKVIERQAAAHKAEVDSLKGMMTGLTQGQREQQQASEMQRWGVNQELAFEVQEPSYRAAMDFLRQSREEELTELGVTDPQQRTNIIAQDVNNIALVARRDGGNFAERLYKQAVRRGFMKAAPVPLAAAIAAPVIPPIDAATTARSARIEEGRQNADTIGSLGSAPPVRLSVEKIANMSDAQFDALQMRLKAQGNGALQDLMGH